MKFPSDDTPLNVPADVTDHDPDDAVAGGEMECWRADRDGGCVAR